MNFSKPIEDCFREAGWYPGRNIKDDLTLPEEFSFSDAARQFLNEYGDLHVFGPQWPGTGFRNEIILDPEMAEGENDKDGFLTYYTELTGRKFTPLGFHQNLAKFIAIDEKDRLYLVQDYCYLIAPTIQKGIEIVLTDEYKDGFLAFNEESREWIPSNTYNGWDAQ